MKTGSKDTKVQMLITGDELAELQRHTGQMVEAFGLDSKIERYRGKRPIGLWRWDMDCLIDVVSMALDDRMEYPSRESSAWMSLRDLHTRLKEEYDQAFA